MVKCLLNKKIGADLNSTIFNCQGLSKLQQYGIRERLSKSVLNTAESGVCGCVINCRAANYAFMVTKILKGISGCFAIKR